MPCTRHGDVRLTVLRPQVGAGRSVPRPLDADAVHRHRERRVGAGGDRRRWRPRRIDRTRAVAPGRRRSPSPAAHAGSSSRLCGPGSVGRAAVARRVLGAEVDEHSRSRGRGDPLRDARVGAREREDRPVHRRQQVEIAGSGRPHRAELRRQVAVEQGDEPADALDVDLEHGVGLVESPLRPRRAVVVDLHRQHRPLGDGRVGRQTGERGDTRRARGADRTAARPAPRRPSPCRCRATCSASRVSVRWFGNDTMPVSETPLMSTTSCALAERVEADVAVGVGLDDEPVRGDRRHAPVVVEVGARRRAGGVGRHPVGAAVGGDEPGPRRPRPRSAVRSRSCRPAAWGTGTRSTPPASTRVPVRRVSVRALRKERMPVSETPLMSTIRAAGRSV